MGATGSVDDVSTESEGSAPPSGEAVLRAGAAAGLPSRRLGIRRDADPGRPFA